MKMLLMKIGIKPWKCNKKLKTKKVAFGTLTATWNPGCRKAKTCGRHRASSFSYWEVDIAAAFMQTHGNSKHLLHSGLLIYHGSWLEMKPMKCHQEILFFFSFFVFFSYGCGRSNFWSWHLNDPAACAGLRYASLRMNWSIFPDQVPPPGWAVTGTEGPLK